MNEPSGRFGSCRPARARRTAVDDRFDGFLLADDALVQPFLHLEQLLHFALHQLGDRDAGPLGDDLGDVVLVDLFFEQLRAALFMRRREALFDLICLRCSSGSVPYLSLLISSRFTLGSCPVCARDSRLDFFDLLLDAR